MQMVVKWRSKSSSIRRRGRRDVKTSVTEFEMSWKSQDQRRILLVLEKVRLVLS